MWSILGIILAFAAIVARKRLRIPDFGLALMAGSFVLGLLTIGLTAPAEIPKAFLEASFYSFSSGRVHTSTVELVLLMSLILTLARTLQETGGIEKLVGSLRSLLPHGETLGIIPSIYGLMPMVGGAMLSAPMIDSEGDRYGLSQPQKNFLNIWFRHMWMPVYPVSGAMILACSEAFAAIPVHRLVAVNIPMFLVFMIIGTITIRRFLKTAPNRGTRKPDASGLVYLVPILAPLVVYAMLQPFEMGQIRALILGITVSIGIVWSISRVPALAFMRIMRRSISISLVSAIFGIMIFRQTVDITGTGRMIAEFIQAMHLPPLSVVLLIPFILAAMTGYNLGAIALSFPLVEPFFQILGTSAAGGTSLMYAATAAGYLVSPMHLCNALSSEYLRTDTARMYPYLIPACAAVIGVQTLFVTAVSTF